MLLLLHRHQVDAATRNHMKSHTKCIWRAAQKTSARIGKAATPASCYTRLATEGYKIVLSMLRGRKKKSSLPHAAMRVPRLSVITFRVFALLMPFSLPFLRMESQNQVNPATTRLSGPAKAASTGFFLTWKEGEKRRMRNKNL